MSEKATSDGPPTPVPPPLSPPRIRTSLSRTKLTFPGVANLFVSLKRAQVRGAAAAAAKPHHIVSTSGDEPLTHPALAPEEAVSPRQVELSREDTFVCTGGVDAAKLVRVVRDNLLQNAISVGANVLIKEQWICDIHEPKSRSDHTYRVHIQYSACAARSSNSDPRKPVALENAKSVPGLMTVVQRQARA